MLNLRIIFALACAGSLLSADIFAQAPAEGLKIVLIRHAEKPEQGDTLSCQGVNRANALPAVLHAKIGVPGSIYVPSVGKSDAGKHSRMFQTITPFSDQYRITPNMDYKVSETGKLAKQLLKQQGTVLVVWEHNGLEEIAAELGVKEKLRWKGRDFDSIWIITYSRKGKARLVIDREGLHPSAECK